MEAKIDLIRSNLQKERLVNELRYLKENDNLSHFDNYMEINAEERLSILEKALTGEGNTHKKLTKDDLFTEIDKHMYKKLWNRLNTVYKVTKLREYLKNEYEKESFYNKLVKELVDLAESNQLNTKKSVIYDPNAEKILSIPILTIDNTKKTYTIKVEKEK